MSYEGIKLSPARLPVATASDLGAVLIGENITNLAGTISLVSGNVTAALGFTPIDKAGDALTGMLTLSADPTDALHAATKQYVDTLAQGLRDFKDSVRAVSVSDITLSGEQTVDGIALVTGDRILVTGQADASQNGIYVVDSGAWPRSEDAQVSADVTSGMYVLVTEGSTYAATSWVLTTSGAITLGTTALTFVQFSGAAQIVAGGGLSKTGNMLEVVAADSTITVNADSIQVGEGSLGNGHIAADAAIAYSKLDLAGSLVDADVAAGAGIAYSKLNLWDSISDSDIAATAGISYTKLNMAGAIVDSDIAASAMIGYAKLNLTGSIMGSDIATGAIDYAKLNLAGSIVGSDIAAGTIDYTKLSLAGSIVGADIAAATIDYSKLSIAGSLVDADIAAGAEISDTKLATISTPGKVSDSALSSNVVLKDAAATFTGEASKLTVIPSGSAGAGLNVPHGSAPSAPVDGDVWTTAAGFFAQINGTSVQFGAGNGSVTSVDLSMPAMFNVTGNPVTDSGTLTAELASQSANLVFAAPDGSAGAPEFRALVAADLPAATASELGVASAGAGLAVSAGAFSVDFGSALRAVNVVTASGSVTCGASDDVVIVNKGTGEATAVTLPASPAVGKQVVVKDGKGDASTNNITVSADSGTIDGASSQVIDGDYGARMFVYNGSEWNVL
jgi:hypothetical protein